MPNGTLKAQTKLQAFRYSAGNRPEKSKPIPASASVEDVAAWLKDGYVVKSKTTSRWFNNERKVVLYLSKGKKGWDPFGTAQLHRESVKLAVLRMLDTFNDFPEMKPVLNDIREELVGSTRLRARELKKALNKLSDAIKPDDPYLKDFTSKQGNALTTWCNSVMPNAGEATTQLKSDLTSLQKYLRTRHERLTRQHVNKPVSCFIYREAAPEQTDPDSAVTLKDVALACERLVANPQVLAKMGADPVLAAVFGEAKEFLANRPDFSDELFGRKDAKAVYEKLKADRGHVHERIRMLSAGLNDVGWADVAKNGKPVEWNELINAFVDHIVTQKDGVKHYLCTRSFDIAVGIGSMLLDDRHQLESEDPGYKETVSIVDMADNALVFGKFIEANITAALIARTASKKYRASQQYQVFDAGRVRGFSSKGRGASLFWRKVNSARQFFQVHPRLIESTASRTKQRSHAYETAQARREVFDELKRHEEIFKAAGAAVAAPKGLARLDAFGVDTANEAANSVVSASAAPPAQIAILTEASQYGDVANVLHALERNPSEHDGVIRVEMMRGAARSLAALHRKGFACIDLRPENMAVFKATSASGNASAGFDIRFATVRHATKKSALPAFSPSADFRWQPPEWINGGIGTEHPGFDPKKADAWALGIFVYQLFHPEGKLPFEADDADGMKTALDLYRRGFDDGTESAMEGLSAEHLKRLGPIAHLLHPDPTRRLSVDEAFELIETVRPISGQETLIAGDVLRRLERVFEASYLNAANVASAVPVAAPAAPAKSLAKRKKGNTNPASGKQRGDTKFTRDAAKANRPRRAISQSETAQQSAKSPNKHLLRSPSEESDSIVRTSVEETSESGDETVKLISPRVGEGASKLDRQRSHTSKSPSPSPQRMATKYSAKAPRESFIVRNAAPIKNPELRAALRSMAAWEYADWAVLLARNPTRVGTLVEWLVANEVITPVGSSTSSKNTHQRVTDTRAPSRQEIQEIFEMLDDAGEPAHQSDVGDAASHNGAVVRAEYQDVYKALMRLFADLQSRDLLDPPPQYGPDGVTITNAS